MTSTKEENHKDFAALLHYIPLQTPFSITTEIDWPHKNLAKKKKSSATTTAVVIPLPTLPPPSLLLPLPPSSPRLALENKVALLTNDDRKKEEKKEEMVVKLEKIEKIEKKKTALPFFYNNEADAAAGSLVEEEIVIADDDTTTTAKTTYHITNGGWKTLAAKEQKWMPLRVMEDKDNTFHYQYKTAVEDNDNRQKNYSSSSSSSGSSGSSGSETALILKKKCLNRYTVGSESSYREPEQQRQQQQQCQICSTAIVGKTSSGIQCELCHYILCTLCIKNTIVQAIADYHFFRLHCGGDLLDSERIKNISPRCLQQCESRKNKRHRPNNSELYQYLIQIVICRHLLPAADSRCDPLEIQEWNWIYYWPCYCHFPLRQFTFVYSPNTICDSPAASSPSSEMTVIMASSSCGGGGATDAADEEGIAAATNTKRAATRLYEKELTRELDSYLFTKEDELRWNGGCNDLVLVRAGESFLMWYQRQQNDIGFFLKHYALSILCLEKTPQKQTLQLEYCPNNRCLGIVVATHLLSEQMTASLCNSVHWCLRCKHYFCAACRKTTLTASDCTLSEFYGWHQRHAQRQIFINPSPVAAVSVAAATSTAYWDGLIYNRTLQKAAEASKNSIILLGRLLDLWLAFSTLGQCPSCGLHTPLANNTITTLEKQKKQKPPLPPLPPSSSIITPIVEKKITKEAAVISFKIQCWHCQCTYCYCCQGVYKKKGREDDDDHTLYPFGYKIRDTMRHDRQRQKQMGSLLQGQPIKKPAVGQEELSAIPSMVCYDKTDGEEEREAKKIQLLNLKDIARLPQPLWVQSSDCIIVCKPPQVVTAAMTTITAASEAAAVGKEEERKKKRKRVAAVSSYSEKVKNNYFVVTALQNFFSFQQATPQKLVQILMQQRAMACLLHWYKMWSSDKFVRVLESTRIAKSQIWSVYFLTPSQKFDVGCPPRAWPAYSSVIDNPIFYAWQELYKVAIPLVSSSTAEGVCLPRVEESFKLDYVRHTII